ncbi:MAG TPA: hypothetical protein DCY20_02500, partial [Firmicutes bacterium]|nr:hypothetical protein [Bacillota bacterium]
TDDSETETPQTDNSETQNPETGLTSAPALGFGGFLLSIGTALGVLNKRRKK